MEESYSALLFIIMAVFIGAATRHFLKGLRLPFTVLLLLIGILLGVLMRLGCFDSWGAVDVSFIAGSLNWAANIDPHLLLFVFLPILIFEASFNMDLHTFKRSAINATILSVPGVAVALLLTGLIVYAVDYFNIGLEGWANWSIAFMFGSVISATDPVAVVSLLKEVGASKKLSTLIEGESLLNDGTAIVFFMVFFGAVTGEASSNGFIEFFRVSIGGIAVGAIIGFLMIRWLKDVFNDALVEISIVVAAAYITFYIAEHFFHVSGVIALMTLGLLIGGIGKTSISPHVQHFMHEFWDLAGFIANSMIFIIAGLVIATRTHFTANDFISLIIVYVGIHVVRAIMIAMHFPFMKNTGYGLRKKEAVVLWYGGLRGAIALALALIVSGVDNKYLPQSIKDQFMFLIAGTVTLTLLINATTTKMLIDKLGLAKISPAKVIMNFQANQYIRHASEIQINRIKDERDFKKTDWDKVKEYLPEEAQQIDTNSTNINMLSETRRKLLEKEKSSYWHQFKDGLLGRESVRILSDSISELLDERNITSLAHRKDLEESWSTPEFLNKLRKWPLINRWAESQLMSRLVISHDCAIGFIEAQDQTLKLVGSMARNKEDSDGNLLLIEEEINENKIHGQTFIRNLRKNYPEIYVAISTQQAIRKVLNYERQNIEKLQKNGRIDEAEAERMNKNLDNRLKHFVDSSRSINVTSTKKEKEDAD